MNPDALCGNVLPPSLLVPRNEPHDIPCFIGLEASLVARSDDTDGLHRLDLPPPFRNDRQAVLAPDFQCFSKTAALL